MDNAFKSKNGFKILYTQISWGTLLTQREEDKRVRRGKAAAKGGTVIFWRLAGGDEEELLALRVLVDMIVSVVGLWDQGEGAGLRIWPNCKCPPF